MTEFTTVTKQAWLAHVEQLRSTMSRLQEKRATVEDIEQHHPTFMRA